MPEPVSPDRLEKAAGRLGRAATALAAAAVVVAVCAVYLAAENAADRRRLRGAEEEAFRGRLAIEKLRLEQAAALDAARQTRELAEREWRRAAEASRQLIEAAARTAPAVAVRPHPVGDPAPPPLRGRAWGAEQANGAPARPTRGGDYAHAWAPLAPNDGAQWLEVRYAAAVAAVGVNVHETFNPGALTRVTAFDDQDAETELWRGDDPVQAVDGVGVAAIRWEGREGGPFTTRILRLYLDTDRVDGWNEIDAVGLVAADGVEHWAVEADASTTYAARAPARRPAEPLPQEEEVF